MSLSRNFGHQTALTAGLDHARGDAVVMLDADLQDPPELITTMLDHWRGGLRRRLRGALGSASGESRFKLTTALGGSIACSTSSPRSSLHNNSGDFRLLDRRALDALLGDA